MNQFNEDQLNIIRDSWEGIQLIIKNIIEPSLEVAKNELEDCTKDEREDLLNKGEIRSVKDILYQITQVADDFKKRS